MSALARGDVHVTTVGLFSDIHFAIVDQTTLDLADQWVCDVAPDVLHLNGDSFDLGEWSHYPKGVDRVASAVEEIKRAVPILNRWARRVKRLQVLTGNHENRWLKMLGGDDARRLAGTIGLTFPEQCRAHGLDPEIRWQSESARTPWVEFCGRIVGGPQGVYARHGDRQSGRFGGGVNIATNRLGKNNGSAEVVGHHHTAQIAYRTAFDVETWAMALPTMSLPQDFQPNPNWQRGWGALSIARRGGALGATVAVQPSLVIPCGGVALWGGRSWVARPAGTLDSLARAEARAARAAA